MPQTIYFKRYRMERELNGLPPVPELPEGFVWMPWALGLLETHAHVKHLCFQGEIDSVVFSSLSNFPGCVDLMRAIVTKSGFCPQATWLIAGFDGFRGTVQGLRDVFGCGMIQNLGVVPTSRGMGLGTALLLRSLHGFRALGLKRCSLEVTVRNEAAVRMYRGLGFRATRTIYRAVEVEESALAAVGTEPVAAPR